jgi:general L-amino acid transport system permease protein
VVRWLRQNLFSSPVSTAVTLTLLYLAVRALWSLYEWPCLNAIWSLPDNQTQACRAIRGIGACWAVIGEKYRFILFGTYPFDDQWRPALAVVVFVLLYLVLALRWRRELVLIWIAALATIGWLMWGGFLGLSFVPQDRWGGLATFGLAFGFPLGILVATNYCGRRSRSSFSRERILPKLSAPASKRSRRVRRWVGVPNCLPSKFCASSTLS